MNRYLLVFIFILQAICSSAQDFDEYFEDNTMRIDYAFAGNNQQQSIYLKGLFKKDEWAGRKARLAEEFLSGNGQLRVFDHASGKLIYVHTFSTLFTEWLLEEEATRVSKSFDASYNIPFPKKPVDVKITLTNNHRKVVAELNHTIDPKDILIRKLGDNGTPYKYIIRNGSITDCIDLAIVAEGYTADEMDKFYKDCDRACDALFTHEPFTTLKKKFNVVAVAPTSLQSGPSVPHDGTWTNTALGTHFDTFYSQRYLTTPNDQKLNDILSGVPFEHIIVLVNTSIYGGGGIFNEWLTCSTDHPTFNKVLVHEFGHSFAGLADEYAYGEQVDPPYPADTEPWEPNITTKKDFDSKWKDMMGKDGVGLFEGAGYMKTGCFRPVDNCRMKVNEVKDFCPVCTRAIIRITDFYSAK